jgi:CTP:molybdopterin cytidylyltransferase MocA
VSFGAIVLAAGASERMGASKPLLRIGQTTFLEHVLDQLDEVPDIAAVVVVLGARAPLIKEQVDFGRAVAIQHRGYKEGMFSSVRAGARALIRKLPDLSGAIVCLVDMPLTPSETYARVVDAYQPERDDVVIAAFQGEAGHPILLSRTLVERLADVSLAAPSEDTLADFIATHAERRRFVDAQDPTVLININTPDAYKTHIGDLADPEPDPPAAEGEGAHDE